MIDSQMLQIKNYLKAGNSITPIEALTLFNCFRLSARIADLRDKGIAIKTTMIKDGKKHFASYSIVE